MKINDIYTWIKFNLYESPILGSDQTLSPVIPDFYKKFKPTDQTIEDFELWGFSIDKERAFALVKDNIFYTILVAIADDAFPKNGKKETLIIRQTETPPEFKGKGYSPALIDGLAKFGYRIISDEQLSKNAFNVWKKLLSKRKHDIKYWDMNKREYTTENLQEKPHIRYVLEHVTFKQKSLILKDRTFWT